MTPWAPPWAAPPAGLAGQRCGLVAPGWSGQTHGFCLSPKENGVSCREAGHDKAGRVSPRCPPGLSVWESQDKCAFSGLPTASRLGPLTLREIPMERAPRAFSVTAAVDRRWRSEHFASAQSWLWGSVEDSCPVHPGPGPREQRQGQGGPPTNGVARTEPVSAPQRPPGRHGVTSSTVTITATTTETASEAFPQSAAPEGRRP